MFYKIYSTTSSSPHDDDNVEKEPDSGGAEDDLDGPRLDPAHGPGTRAGPSSYP